MALIPISASSKNSGYYIPPCLEQHRPWCSRDSKWNHETRWGKPFSWWLHSPKYPHLPRSSFITLSIGIVCASWDAPLSCPVHEEVQVKTPLQVPPITRTNQSHVLYYKHISLIRMCGKHYELLCEQVNLVHIPFSLSWSVSQWVHKI